MEAFYVTIIFLGVLLVSASLFLIVMDRVNGKDFFKEFDRKKDEMFNLIQDSEEMVQELNRMSDYVLTAISEKNQEFFNKNANLNMQKTSTKLENASGHESEELVGQVQENLISPISEDTPKLNQVSENTPNQSQTSEATKTQNSEEAIAPQNEEPNVEKSVNMQFSYNKDINIKDLPDVGKTKLTLNSRRKEVLQLIEQGLSNDEISDKLKIGKGEIGLIRGLSK